MKLLSTIKKQLFIFPLNILGFFIFGALWVFDQIEDVFYYKDGAFVWDLSNKGWFCKKFFTGRGWIGFGFGNHIIVVDPEETDTLVEHELSHYLQMAKWGIILFPILYLGSSIIIYLFQKQKHAYHDNVFEKDARERAGEEVETPREKWKTQSRWFW